ncbi:MAG TPA: hypothetical protein VMT29_08510 [Steroidobacteraceae bacterium]|nr:hypothetical protein [Steroidobacteraceae bacterium]
MRTDCAAAGSPHATRARCQQLKSPGRVAPACMTLRDLVSLLALIAGMLLVLAG